MIQDMFDPEIYISSFRIRDLSTGTERMRCAKYRDLAPCGTREEIIPDSIVNADRQSFYCVSIPGESPWVKEAFGKMSPGPEAGSGSRPQNSLKRSHEESQEMEMEEDKKEQEEKGGQDEAKKRAKTEDGGVAYRSASRESGSMPNRLNLPIPECPNAKAAIVKVYNAVDTAFSLNDCIEFVGIVSLDPALAVSPMDGVDQDPMVTEHATETAKSLSLVPRIHVISYRKIFHNNPCLLPSINTVTATPEIEGELGQARAELHGILTKALLGDSVAADFLICHLVSKIYLKKDALTLGKFSLNLHNVPCDSNYAKRLATLIQLLTTSSHFLPLTVDNVSLIPSNITHIKL